MVEYIVAIDVTRVRFPADVFLYLRGKTAQVLINRWTCLLDSWCEGQHCGFCCRKSGFDSWRGPLCITMRSIATARTGCLV